PSGWSVFVWSLLPGPLFPPLFPYTTLFRSPAARGNVNCPLAVARSAVLFVVRTLLPEDVPTNGGVTRVTPPFVGTSSGNRVRTTNSTAERATASGQLTLPRAAGDRKSVV